MALLACVNRPVPPTDPDADRTILVSASPRIVRPTVAGDSRYEFQESRQVVEIVTSSIQGQVYLDAIMINGSRLRLGGATPRDDFYAIVPNSISVHANDYGDRICPVVEFSRAGVDINVEVEACGGDLKRLIEWNLDGEIVRLVEFET